MLLACPNRCSITRFELWNASVYVDEHGRYLEHHVDAPLYRCTQCGSPAVDLGEVPDAMRADREQDREPMHEYACPACEALFAAPRGQTPVVCPECGQTFVVSETGL